MGPTLRPPEKMVTSEALDGVPILVLANKQDVEVRGIPGLGCRVSGTGYPVLQCAFCPPGVCMHCRGTCHALIPTPQTCLSIPDLKTAFSDCTSKIGRRDCLTQACSALTG